MADTEALQNNPDVTRGVTAQEAQQRLLRALLAEWVHSMIPGRVQRVETNANGQTVVDVQPGVQDFHRNEEGALVSATVPQVTNVPVVFLTAGGFTFTVPIQAGANGTTGALIFSERSLDRWLAGDGAVVNPELYSRFNLSDAIFIPGLMPFGMSSGPNAPTDHATAGSIGGARIHFRSGTICVGDESGSDFLARAQKVLDELQSIALKFNSHTHQIAGVQAGAATVTSATPSTTYSPASVATDQAKGH